MTSETLTVEPVAPTWVLTFPEMLPPEAAEHITEQAHKAIESGRPVVLGGGAMLYDARNSGAPLPAVTALDATTEYDFPRWMAVALVAMTFGVLMLAFSAVVLIVVLLA